MKKVYFRSFNGIRFIAALSVIIYHIEQTKMMYKFDNYFDIPFMHILGKLGVILFFVLSGFLITYLLMQERAETKTISIKDFYIRRILRIWPLYYVIVLAGLFIMPQFHFFDIPGWTDHMHSSFGLKVLLFMIFVPNIAQSLILPIPYIGQCWSVGVEEQFYLIWPVLIKKVKDKVVNMLFGVIIFYLILRFSFVFLHNTFPTKAMFGILNNFWENYFNIDCMAIGGLASYILFKDKQKLLKILYSVYTQIAVYVLLILMFSFGLRIEYITFEPYAILFAIMLLNLAGNKKSILNLEFKFLSYLGKISYGLYMYHQIAIVITIKILYSYGFDNILVHYIAGTLLSVIVAALSYELIESKFIKRKVKYSKIISGDNAK